MSNNSSKPSIPAWQRANPDVSSVNDNDNHDTTTSSNEAESSPQVDQYLAEQAKDAAADDEDSGETAPSVSSQMEQVEALLQDPILKSAPIEKKRAFLESKSVPQETIHRILEEAADTPSSSVNAFQNFTQEHSPPQTTTPKPAAPAIITYPEFLVDAHRPPPLITVDRVLNTTYLASGLVALIYGASKFLVQPMAENLAAARHDFATHSQSKIDEFNQRLSKIVSRLPEQKKDPSSGTEDEELDSVVSDPTELFHRDVATQTSPTRASHQHPLFANLPEPNKLDYQSNGLSVLRTHLDELATGMEKSGESISERHDSMGQLRHYLDSLLYGSPSYNLWGGIDDNNSASKGKDDDAIEDLKKEIRSVKGVLLSARRFPSAAAGRVGA